MIEWLLATSNISNGMVVVLWTGIVSLVITLGLVVFKGK